MVSSVCSFTHAFNKSNDALKNNSEFLSNRSMKEDAENLLISGVISYSIRMGLQLIKHLL